MYYREGKVHLSAVPLVDYSQDEEWDSDQMNFQISSNERPVNHLICLGKGDLSERMVRHLYMDARGNISETQTFFGVDEVTETYDYSNVESEEELITGGTQRLQELGRQQIRWKQILKIIQSMMLVISWEHGRQLPELR